MLNNSGSLCSAVSEVSDSSGDPARLLLVVSHHSVLQHNSPKQNTFTLKDLALPLARGMNVVNAVCEIFHFKELFMLKSDPQNNKCAS